jgi:hypothetical protein
MSALGHKRTCAAQKVMSALPPKADMCGATRGPWLVGPSRVAIRYHTDVGCSRGSLPPDWSGVSRVFTYSIVVPLAEPLPSDTFAFQAQAVHAVGTAIKFG